MSLSQISLFVPPADLNGAAPAVTAPAVPGQSVEPLSFLASAVAEYRVLEAAFKRMAGVEPYPVLAALLTGQAQLKACIWSDFDYGTCLVSSGLRG